MQGKRLIVIGGGAAGFFCAVNAARLHPGLKVTILEKTGKFLSKLRISGGGRCNVTHACFDIPAMSQRYPRGSNFVKKTFHQFFTTDTISWFEERGVAFKTEEDGRMFPVTDLSDTIVDCLMREVNKYQVELLLNQEVIKVEPTDGKWRVETANGKQQAADFLCIASGGYPKTSMFNWLQELGHTIAEPVPSLFTFNMPANPVTKLMGVAVPDAKIRVGGSKLESSGPLLITHWGMSGPAVLKLSAWGARELKARNYNFTIAVNWVPGSTEQQLRDKFQQFRFELATQKISGRNLFGLPQRLWEFLLEYTHINKDTRWADLTARDQNRLIKNTYAAEFDIKGKTTFKEEFVTAGGINLTEVDHHSLMSKKAANLFFAGEVLDVDGITGGYNFQHAWTSGFIVAKNLKME